MLPMVWLLFGALIVAEVLLIAPMEPQARLMPDGRTNRFPMVIRANRTALYLVAIAVDLVAAAGFLMWPMDVFGSGGGGILAAALLGPMMLVGPATWWLLGALDASSKALSRGGDQ